MTALASYLDARSQGGTWLVRIEDIDPPREQPGAAGQILRCLEAHGLDWDESPLFQSTRTPEYHQVVDQLLEAGLAYRCTCSRLQLGKSKRYPGTCANRSVPAHKPAAVRLRVDIGNLGFDDQIQGPQSVPMDKAVGDFVIRRKDGLIAYQLAVAWDDSAQNITRVVRGNDLLDSTFRQLFLLQKLRLQNPSYAHIPVLGNLQGQKLSKQNGAPALGHNRARNNLVQALTFLGQAPPIELREATTAEIVTWGVTNWNIAKLPASNIIKLLPASGRSG